MEKDFMGLYSGAEEDVNDNDIRESELAVQETVTKETVQVELHESTQEAVSESIQEEVEEETQSVVQESEQISEEQMGEPNFYSYGRSFDKSQYEKDVDNVTAENEANVSGEKKKSGFFRCARFVGMAAAFGIIAGSVFYGVNYAADKLFGTKVVTPDSVMEETAGIVINKNDTSAITTGNGSMKVMDVSQIVENSMPSAVAITGKVVQSFQMSPFFGGNYETESPVSGSGIIIGQNATELLMVTNAHVVDGVSGLTVTFIDGSTAEAVIKGMKSNKDIAVIAVPLSNLNKETLDKIAIVEIGDSESLKMGQPVIAIGNAMGEGQSSTVGWVSALNRTIVIDGNEYENLIMTDAAINPGNSGGALLNMDGQLIGINSAKYSDESVEGMGYAIPISAVADIINDLMNREIRSKVAEDKIGYLGCSGMDIDSAISQTYGWPKGVLITSISNGSPCERSGLLKNDIIVEFDGEDITSFDELRELMEYYAEGETVVVDYYRLENGEYVLKSSEVTLGNRSAGK